MKQVRYRVVPLDICPAGGVHRHANRFADFRRAAIRQLGAMDMHFTLALRIEHLQLSDLRAIVPGHVHQPRVAHLSAHLGVKWSLIENEFETLRLGRRDSFNHRFCL